MTDDISIRTEGDWGILTLTRGKALNSLTQAMCKDIDAALAKWADDDAVKAVLVEGEGDRAFCAGGDIRWLAETGKNDPVEAATFFRDEYRMNVRIHQFPKPYVALMDGVTMGGGVGISMSASHRVVSERTVWAMPECMIGLVPDVGASWLLPRLARGLGAFLGLTGRRLQAGDMLTAGLATHHLPSSKWDDMRSALVSRDLGGDASASIDEVLCKFHERVQGDLVTELSEIAELFGEYGNLPHLVTKLESSQSELSDFASREIGIASPTSLTLTHRLLTNPPEAFEDCIAREFCVAAHLMAGHDFREGVRALIIDKDKSPQWLPSSLHEIDGTEIAVYFEEPEGGPLDLSGM